MLSDKLPWYASRLQIGSRSADWADLIEEPGKLLSASLSDNSRGATVFSVEGIEQALSSLGFARKLGIDAAVIESHRNTGELSARLRSEGFHNFDWQSGSLDLADEPRTPLGGGAYVLSSGTTGPVKIIAHSWTSLNTFDRLRGQTPRSWYVPYQIGTYAWYQMISLNMHVPEQRLVFSTAQDPVTGLGEVVELGGVDAISSTPSFWRAALYQHSEEVLASLPLKLISLGGEVVDQVILDQLAELYPSAHIRHIYASSEVGAAIVVNDKRAGFPSEYLGDSTRSIQLRLKDGRLQVRSPYASPSAANSADEWIDTGDEVEIEGDRAFVVGRAGRAMINVGGQKVWVSEVEQRLMQHADVVWAQVYPRRAPLVGQMPAARVVLRQETLFEDAESELTRHCHEGLPDYAVPRLWAFLDEIPLKTSLKS